jgi:predicted urease superfamily metal-dependent hydrolase
MQRTKKEGNLDQEDNEEEKASGADESPAALELFKQNCPNTVAVGEVGQYTHYEVDQKVLKTLIDSLKSGQMPSL